MDDRTQDALARAATRSEEVARAWRAQLDAADRDELVAAFHRAEGLAQFALEDAIAQVDEGYRADLREQLAEEERHVDVFARWQAEPRVLERPRTRERPQSLWLAMLLVNELAGFCQFHMLLALLDDPERGREVEEILTDERKHVARLVRWLEPHWRERGARVLHDFLRGFRRGLPGRMGQFFPRPELVDLRAEMAEVVDELVGELTPAA